MTTIASIRRRQGIAPPITPAQHAEYERAKAERRAKNVVNAVEILTRNHVQFKQRAVTGSSAHSVLFAFEVFNPKDIAGITYYPEIGLWHDADGGAHYGCRNLVKHLKGECL